MSSAWLKCVARPGIFSDESIVEVTTWNGTERAYTVPKTQVAHDRVRVRVTKHEGTLWARLPTDHPYHAIPIRAPDLSEDPVSA